MALLADSWGQALIDKVKLELAKKVDTAAGPRIFAGSVAFANLPAAAAETFGFVYNVTDAFTTTADFLEGAGIACAAGTDVVVVKLNTLPNPTFKYNLYSIGGSGPIDVITDAELEEMWKDAGSVTLSTNAVSVAETMTADVTASDATGVLTVTSSDTGVATALLDTSGAGTDPVVRISGVSAGTCVVTVGVASSATNRAASEEIQVTVTAT